MECREQKPDPVCSDHRAGEQCCPVIRAIPRFATEKCGRDSNKRGGRSQRITAMMPLFLFDRVPLVLPPEPIYVPKKEFLNDDNYNKNSKRERCRSVMWRQNFANTFDGETSRGSEHAQPDGDGGDWFGFPVTVRMGFIRRSRRNG